MDWLLILQIALAQKGYSALEQWQAPSSYLKMNYLS